ncbi:alpha/beta hydrolase [Colwellia sp. MB02u-18]|uniref:alpha/beta fold hydrolase n=1 Tax=unclassified Colwellia TaxID=196834 RepID=UPI0015F77400|nr:MULTISPECIES: alpha/beta hydrolase [unclassified Colwellia]MBA6224548.1 alpha/beta hydrolase [Colwellia sp. MB3u-45]MBA6268140.1 alpha/beta hydrolase [Colwellia sp. MB3u-43]MBA6322592.1 alpha/beta hydrolase [Colwellia sp. MB02u-19]MBA6326170.1 alpha/beta hydrolase [Colwellia sp. MB02u-18]MBA6331629.1 alpha/beta hydrolase [Colwellia sp. MB02u-12]
MSQTIYFIPGTMCDEHLWLPVWQRLQEQCHEDHQLISLAIPNTGCMDEVVSALAEKIVAHKAILVGFSLGGYIASAIALKLDNKLKHLLIVSNFPKNLPIAEIKQRKRTTDLISQRGYCGIPDKRVDDLLHPEIKQLNRQGYQDIKQIIVAMDRTLGVDVLLHQLRISMHRPNLLPGLARLSLPITLLVGDADNLVDLASLKQALHGASHIVLKEIPHTGHMLPLESPQAFATMLMHLLAN